jgi:hypothetical protein
MAIDSILLHNSNLVTISNNHLAITGSHLLITSIVSLIITESPFKTYKMLG